MNKFHIGLTGKSSDALAVVAVDAVDAGAVVLAWVRQAFVHVDLTNFAWKIKHGGSTIKPLKELVSLFNELNREHVLCHRLKIYFHYLRQLNRVNLK